MCFITIKYLHMYLYVYIIYISSFQNNETKFTTLFCFYLNNILNKNDCLFIRDSCLPGYKNFAMLEKACFHVLFCEGSEKKK